MPVHAASKVTDKAAGCQNIVNTTSDLFPLKNTSHFMANQRRAKVVVVMQPPSPPLPSPHLPPLSPQQLTHINSTILHLKKKRRKKNLQNPGKKAKEIPPTPTHPPKQPHPNNPKETNDKLKLNNKQTQMYTHFKSRLRNLQYQTRLGTTLR